MVIYLIAFCVFGISGLNQADPSAFQFVVSTFDSAHQTMAEEVTKEANGRRKQS